MRKAMKNRQTDPKCTEQMLSSIPAEFSRNQNLIPCLLKFVQAEYVGVIFWTFISGCLHWVAKNSKIQSSECFLEQILLEDNFTCWHFDCCITYVFAYPSNFIQGYLSIPKRKPSEFTLLNGFADSFTHKVGWGSCPKSMLNGPTVKPGNVIWSTIWRAQCWKAIVGSKVP
jgi:hypothetical protein